MSIAQFYVMDGCCFNTAGGKMAARQERVLVRDGRLAAARAGRHVHDILHLLSHQ